ncbi:MAG TPA: hypothetical protein DDZ51_00975 [Planctomycetaceae bacterium]|nr:hypothetical protein [Planctomycetaceae bacterium]
MGWMGGSRECLNRLLQHRPVGPRYLTHGVPAVTTGNIPTRGPSHHGLRLQTKYPRPPKLRKPPSQTELPAQTSFHDQESALKLMRPIRLLVMISSMDGGGSERQTLLLLKHLDRRRFAPELYLLHRTGSLLDQVPADVPIHCFEDAQSRSRSSSTMWNTPITKVVSRVKRLPLPGKIHRHQVADVAAVLAQRQIDVLYDRTFHMTLIAGPAALAVGVPRVSTIVSPPSRAVPLNAGRFLSIKKRRLRDAYRQSEAVIAVSHPTARDAAAFYQLPRSRFVVVANPVDSDLLDQSVATSPVPDRDNRYTIACVGRISAEKGQMELVQAMKKLRSDHSDQPLPRIWMIGDGPLRATLQQTVRDENLDGSIEFIGHVAQPAPWIAIADAVCIPSYFEGFPNVMLESMALGVPVIARSIDVVRSLGRIAADQTIRGRTYVTTFESSTAEMGFDLARKIVRTRKNSTATRSKTTSARRLARQALSIASGMARIERILLKAFVDRLAEKQRQLP